MSISSLVFSLVLCFSIFNTTVSAQKRRAPGGGRVAIVIDERLGALRDAPSLTAALILRMSRGKLVAIRGERKTPDGITFARVNVSSRTSGWLQRDALAIPNQRSDEERLLKLIQASDGFDRLARARIFLDEFPKSRSRPAVLLIFGDAVESAASKLTSDALRRLKSEDLISAPEFSYYLNFAGLDRYNRHGIRFIFDRERKAFHYDGAVWKELLRRFPHTSEAAEARKRLIRVVF